MWEGEGVAREGFLEEGTLQIGFGRTGDGSRREQWVCWQGRLQGGPVWGSPSQSQVGDALGSRLGCGACTLDPTARVQGEGTGCNSQPDHSAL